MITLFFAGRFTVQTPYWSTHYELPVRAWMTLGYIARSWDLDPRAIEAAAGLSPPVERGNPQPLAKIARDRLPARASELKARRGLALWRHQT